MRGHPVVLIVQDTTELDFTQHPTDDARCLNTELRFGLHEQVHLAVTLDKLCLGVAGSEFFDRTPESLGKSHERRTLPIEQKESFRWLKGFRLACELATECPQTRIGRIADREADIHDIFVEAQQQTGPRADYWSNNFHSPRSTDASSVRNRRYRWAHGRGVRAIATRQIQVVRPLRQPVRTRQ